MGGLVALFRRRGGEGQVQQGSRVTDQDRAVLSLKQQRDKLKKYQTKINLQLQKEREIAKQLLRDGKKERAKLLLKKKRYLESLLDKTDTQLDNLEQMVENIEFTQIEMKVVEGLKQGNECLEEMHKMMSIEDVERIMSETEDSIQYQREIDELLGQNLTQDDEDAIAAELESILVGKATSLISKAKYMIQKLNGRRPGDKSELPEVERRPPAEEDVVARLPEVPTEPPTLEEEEEGPQKVKQKKQLVAA